MSTPIKNLEFNTQVFKEMGGKYVISAVEIQNFEQNIFEFVGTFEVKNLLGRYGFIKRFNYFN